MSDAFVRPAVADDLPGMIAADDLATAGDAGRLHQLRGAVEAGRCLVEVDDAGVAGFVVTLPDHFFGRDFIDLLMVRPQRRRSGVGRRLLRAAVAAGTSSRVFTSTNASNLPMRELLNGEGWSFSGELLGLDDGDPEQFSFLQRN